MGNTSYIITIVGSQKVGKSALCQQLKSFSEDIQSKRLFRNVGVQPDFQLRMKTNSNTYDLAIYDSLGFVILKGNIHFQI